MNDPAGKDLLLYVQIPFCNSKCHFCDWVTEIPASELRTEAHAPSRKAYVAALQRQILHWGPRLREQGYTPRILYWGGGTASLLTEEEIAAVGQALAAAFDLGNLIEATIETSPETLTPSKLALLRRIGFFRISIGAQTMDDILLRRIGRSHDAAQTSQAVAMARAAGFRDLNIDLIAGLPEDTPEAFAVSLNSALTLGANHVCLYPYRPVAGTVARRMMRNAHRKIAPLEELFGMYEEGRRRLSALGLHEYALGHFGQPPCYSDLAYFALTMDWIGFGSGATSLLDGRYLATRRGNLGGYLRSPLTFDEDSAAAAPQVASRLIYQALTTREGVDRRLWEERLQVPLEDILAIPSVASLVSFLGSVGRLIHDEAGLRLHPEDIAASFIHLLFLNSPRQVRRMAGAAAALGGY